MENHQFDNEKFKTELEKAGYTYLSFSRKLQAIEPKASKSSVWQWTKRAQPSPRYLYAICATLKKDIKFFCK